MNGLKKVGTGFNGLTRVETGFNGLELVEDGLEWVKNGFTRLKQVGMDKNEFH